MILHVYSKKYGLSLTDTNRYQEGSFRLSHTDTQGNVRPLINLENEGAEWVAYETAQASISVDRVRQDGVTLTPGMIYVLFTPAREVYFLLCMDEVDWKKPVELYSLPASGIVTVGHGSQCDLGYPFTLVTQCHAVLRIDKGRVALEDNNSTNGTYLNGASIQKCELAPGDVIDIFGLRIAYLGELIAVHNVFAPVSVSAQLKPYSTTNGNDVAALQQPLEAELFERAPRIAVKREEEHLRIDDPPAESEHEEMPLVFTVGSSALMSMSSMMMAMTSLQNVQASGGDLSKALPSVLMAGGMFLGGLVMPIATRKYTEKRNQQKENERQRKYLAYLEENKKRIAEIGNRQMEYLLQNYPENDVLCDRVAARSPLIWGRMPKHQDFLDLRLGTATQPVDVKIDYPRHSFSLSEDALRQAILDFEDEQKLIENAPFIISLKDTGILGIYAEHSIRMRYVQGLLLQLCAQHSYTEMKLVLVYSKAEEREWEWARWLPHLWNDDKELHAIGTDEEGVRALSSYIDSLSSTDRLSAESDVHCVVVLTDMHLAECCPALTEAMHNIHGKPLSVIALADKVNQLPRECKSVVTLNDKEGYLYRNIDQMETPTRFVQDTVPKARLRSFASQLGRMRLSDGASESELPDMISFYAMMRWGNVAQSDLLTRWRKSNPVKTLAAPVGVDSHGDRMMLDIHQAAHGPHGLVAGMTGSGKSEFIITYILSVAVQYSPLEVGFVLIDYKGGGMSDTLKDLPHVVGVIDNLGGRAGIRRSMNSLESELKRRQRVFKEVGERTGNSNLDIHRYQQLYRQGKVDEPMQHIIIISDEFAELKQQEPEFMDYLVSAARIGRSLGVHLILATQKPSGVVNDQIMSNTRFRVCLKVQDKSDSMEMLSRPDAAMLTKTGRFYLQVGYNDIFVQGQSAWSGAPSIPMSRYREMPDNSLELLDDTGAVIMKTKMPSAEDGIEREKQVDELVQFIRKTAEESKLIPENIWKPMLPAEKLLDEVDNEYKPVYTPGHLDPVIGMVDDPFMQRQYPLQVDFTTGGNTVVYGVTGSGKSEFVSAALYSLCMHHTAREVNIYCLDFASETARMFAEMPQVGDVVVAGEDEKLNNLMRLLTQEVERRRKLLSEYGGTLESFRADHPQADMPAILLIVDNYTTFAEGYEDYEDALYQIIREGPRFGMHTLITCINSSSIRYRMSQNFKQIFCMQMPDKADYTLLLGAGSVTPIERVGSGVLRRDGRVQEFQVGKVRSGDPRVMRQELQNIGRKLQHESSSHARHIRMLPEVVSVEMLCRNNENTPLSAVPIGLDKDNLEIVRWNLAERCINQIGFGVQQEGSFLSRLTEILSRGKNRQILCLDAVGDMQLQPIENVIYNTGAKLSEGVEHLFQQILRRNNEIKTAIVQEKTSPQYDEYVIIINGLAELYDALSGNAEMTTKLNEAVKRIVKTMNITMVFMQNNDRISSINTKEWYRNLVNKDGMWLGEGVRAQFMVKSDNINRSEKLPQGSFGYLVRYGKPICLKLVSG